jgi:hypothetical protein
MLRRSGLSGGLGPILVETDRRLRLLGIQWEVPPAFAIRTPCWMLPNALGSLHADSIQGNG